MEHLQAFRVFQRNVLMCFECLGLWIIVVFSDLANTKTSSYSLYTEFQSKAEFSQWRSTDKLQQLINQSTCVHVLARSHSPRRLLKFLNVQLVRPRVQLI